MVANALDYGKKSRRLAARKGVVTKVSQQLREKAYDCGMGMQGTVNAIRSLTDLNGQIANDIAKLCQLSEPYMDDKHNALLLEATDLLSQAQALRKTALTCQAELEQLRHDVYEFSNSLRWKM